MSQEADIASLRTDMTHVAANLNRIEGQLNVVVQLVGRVERVERDIAILTSRIDLITIKQETITRDAVTHEKFDKHSDKTAEDINALKAWKYGVILVCTVLIVAVPNIKELLKILMQ